MGVGGDRELAREGQDRRGEERETRTVCPNGMEWKEGGRRENGRSDREKMDDNYWPFLCWFFYLANVLACFCDVACPRAVVVCLLVTLVMVCF